MIRSSLAPVFVCCLLLGASGCTKGNVDPHDIDQDDDESSADEERSDGNDDDDDGDDPDADSDSSDEGDGDSDADSSDDTADDDDSDDPDGDDGDTDDDVEEIPTLPDGRGARVPYREYEAEDGETNGTVVGPTRQYTEVASEASGRRAVRLDAEGEYVEITSKARANSIVVRYSIPDSGDGQGIWSTLGVYVDGELRTRLSVTSRYAWTYGPFHDNPAPNDPGRGTPHHFFDESHALIGDIPEGARVMVRKDAEDRADYYIVDLIDLEQVPGPKDKPAGFIDLRECGATPDDNADDSHALQECVDRARGQGRGLYIPPGTFNSWSRVISVGGVTIQGAGMWHSRVQGYFATFDCWDNRCHYLDFGVMGDTVVRRDDATDTAFGGNGSSDVLLDRIWVEHTRVGYWTGPYANNLVIRNSRFRNLHADGVNFWNGTTNSVVENCHFRNTGDDALASWSPGDAGMSTGNTFRHNHIQVPWMANCFGLYGGRDNVIEDNVCADVVQYPGMLFARQFGAHAFEGTTRARRNTLIRAGGPGYGEEQGAIKFHADQGPVQNISVTETQIIEPTFSAFHFQGDHFTNTVWLEDIDIVRPGTAAFLFTFDAHGAADATGIRLDSAPHGGIIDHTRGAFSLVRGDGNEGW
jgi:hypothetical protein